MAPRYCAVYGCTNSSKDKGISPHLFPNTPSLGEQLKRKEFKASNYSSVCSDHFQQEDFECDNKGQSQRKCAHLKKSVIPTIFKSGLPSHLQSGEKKRRVLQRVKPTSNIQHKFPPMNTL